MFSRTRKPLSLMPAIAALLFAVHGTSSAQPQPPVKAAVVEYHPHLARYILADSAVPLLNQKVLNYATSHLGKQVLRGECWDLAKAALEAAGAKVPGRDLPVYVFGRQLAASEKIKPGDIMQFEGVRFQNGSSWQEMRHHTAIVERVSGTTIYLLHQNVNNNRTVQRGQINLAHKVSGSIMTYRPLAK